MPIAAKLAKLVRLARRPRLWRTALVHRVVGAVEHDWPIRFTQAATLIDAGANRGQFSTLFHALRPNATILAFEPLPEAADAYAALFANVPNVHLHRMALSDRTGSATFHIADRADSSSLLAPGTGQEAAFNVRCARTIDVRVDRLDRQVDMSKLSRPIMLKIDVQGAELDVLRGTDNLDAVDFVYVELSFVPLYERQALFDDVASFLRNEQFELAGVFNQVITNRFGPTQADFLFRNARVLS
ncbi:FkbM family methyltransferase [Sphingomonas sp. MA1305]|uniref:FkbM family methyltransferase n=1 Tax=Sphingomonas sp. MA1305 TaxID=2479204 RepID=UPI0018E04814|nr:FkbM family methyltransferase [Sphingomonas sp. MA1305]MBI0477196.1 FkbM family methyltransferase [Sphingomonas sp. MA1305]